jgi:hypothetical protein
LIPMSIGYEDHDEFSYVLPSQSTDSGRQEDA